jgi:predicted nucleic acid-binding protein
MPDKKLRVYLDNCCYNRPYDDQSNIINRVETEAKLAIQSFIRQKKLELVWSFVLEFENDANPFELRRKRIEEWKHLAVIDCALCDEIAEKATQLTRLKLRQKDAGHIACAVIANADYFITTDKKILNKAVADIVCLNPIDFLRRYINDGY